ncbi:MAG: FMN-binding protein, partial [Clostridia bacterium]|nr:FMN-binding protein [Clostridia bacterium]
EVLQAEGQDAFLSEESLSDGISAKFLMIELDDMAAYALYFFAEDQLEGVDIFWVTELRGYYMSGTFYGEGQGYGGLPVSVTLTNDDGDIKAVKVDVSTQTPGIGNRPEEFENAILKAQIANIDGIAGATETSKGVRNAAVAALKQMYEALGMGSSGLRLSTDIVESMAEKLSQAYGLPERNAPILHQVLLLAEALEYSTDLYLTADYFWGLSDGTAISLYDNMDSFDLFYMNAAFSLDNYFGEPSPTPVPYNLNGL